MEVHHTAQQTCNQVLYILAYRLTNVIQPGHSREGRGVHVEVHHTKQMCIQVLYILTYRWRNCDDSQGTAVDPPC